MAYLAPIESAEARPLAWSSTATTPAAKPDFSSLEWSIIRLARLDGMWTLREPGPVSRFFSWLTGRAPNPKLANERLEALRRISVLSWHFGFSVPGEDVADFLSAGFTPDQYELLVSSVRAATAPQLRIISGEVLA